MTPQEVIDRLNSLDLDNCSDKDIVDIFSQMGRGGAINTIYHKASIEAEMPNFFVRASIYDPINEKITSTDRLSYPPLSKNTFHQRASTPDRPMFYAVRCKNYNRRDMLSAIKTCLLESISDYEKLVETNQKVAISLWLNIDDIKLFSVFTWAEFLTQNPEEAEIVTSFNEFIETQTLIVQENTKIILEYLRDRFNIPVGRNNNLYKPSGVISQYILDRLESISVDGIVFPSTKVMGRELNVVIKPNSVKKLVPMDAIDGVFQKDKVVHFQRKAQILPNSKDVEFNEDIDLKIDLK